MSAAPLKMCAGPCRQALPLDAFHRNKSRKDGRQPACKECRASQRATDPEKERERAAAWRAANPEKARVSKLRSARKRYAAAKAEGRCAYGSGYGCQEPARPEHCSVRT